MHDAKISKTIIIFFILLFCILYPVFAKDIYVKAGESGKGTKESPYGDLWKAMEKAIRGDVIHVTEGTYTGKGDSGAFIAKVPHLTLAGGYNGNFSERNPFKYQTILKRAEDYKGDWTGLPGGIIAGRDDHGGLIADGFVLEGRTRNSYKTTGDLSQKGSFSGPLFEANGTDIKIRNCILLNPCGVGIYVTWRGEENEVSNTFVLNTLYTGISTRSAQSDSIITLNHNTIGFVWFQPGKGGGTSVFVGSQGQTILNGNIFMFNQEHAVLNGFGNEDTILTDNLFFQCQGGYYKYMDEDGKNLLIWKSDELEEINEDAEFYMLLEAEGNTDKNPKLKPDKAYFEKFSNYVAGEPGKLNMNEMNEWRKSLGLPLQAEAGTGSKNWAPAYPIESVIPMLAMSNGKYGVNLNGPFESYSSENEAKVYTYKEVEFIKFEKNDSGVKGLKKTPVMFKAGLGPNKMQWYLKAVDRDNYRCVMLLLPGESEYTRKFIYGYILKGSDAEKNWDKYYKKKDKYNKKGGVVIKGIASYIDSGSIPYPVGVVIKEVSRK
jgi:hypothetical protein